MSTPTGIHTQVRQRHEARVLSALRVEGPLTRAELSARAGLSRTTLSEITGSLLKRGAIIIAATDAAGRAGSGRPAEVLALDPASGQFLGVDFGHRRVRVALADASHAVIASGVQGYPDSTDWDGRLAIAFDLIDRLSGETGVHYGALQAIGIGVPGPYTRHGGNVALINHENLAPADVDLQFSERFGAPVTIDNNTRLAALAEAIHAKREAHGDLIYMRVSDGVGGGLVVNGQLVGGARGLAGELGHVTLDPHGRLCRCGKRGCLETVASVPAILSDMRERGEQVDSLEDLRIVLASDVPNPVVEDVLRNAGAAIGRILGATSMTLNPAEVVIGGEITSIAPVLVAQAEASLQEQMYRLPLGQEVVVRAGVLQDSEGAVGAIAAVLYQTPLLAGYSELDFTPEQTHQRSIR
ncbi:ROK family protein [Ornithinimicrobium sp. Arc0846-15]|nr:ROK family protein [Ornithinimicrobium laminariae]